MTLPDQLQRGPVTRRRRVLRVLLACTLGLAAFVYVNNSSWLAGSDGGGPLLLAHRGLAQTFDLAGVENDTCTAELIHQPEHPYLENTIESMRAAFDAGADIVEFDIQVTMDDRIVVFHDHQLECRTNGTGRVREHTLADLRRLDVGYNYTPDRGASYPFRGTGVGLMPTIEEVLAAFPDRELLIDVKSGDPTEGEMLADYLATLPAERLATLSAYGGDEPIAALSARMPRLRVLSKAIMKDCLLRYIAVGWTGSVPDVCEHRELHIPEAYAPYLWGWPNKFVDRMADKGTRVVIVAGDGGFSEGFDSADDWRRLPDGFTGSVWTNRIDRVAPLRDKA
ncbi:glycerophosphodiester phosphodiesterase family protein [Micromonospora eburnea]|uniref:glycerophosphodiester phosphodiesterase family protein n=1 Tax=Micromonospora eburnea TaxID=227316 RepID=UPI001FC8FE9B|nr:glycerophosphodiester phosphodiesterase family protein [Micromonospora eburnea]